MNKPITVLTRKGEAKLKAELDELKSVRRREVADKIKVALSFGDLSENSEYDEAKNEQGKLYSRIAELEEIIKNAVVVTGDSYAADEVSPGCRLVLLLRLMLFCHVFPIFHINLQ